MSDVAIHVRGLSKRYRIGVRESHRTMRDAIASTAAAPFRRIRSLARRSQPGPAGHPTIWALHEISFDVEQGQVLGIIGRNGAGKSTLLKVLSRITLPTEGYAEIRGRVRSLLEVGTGFHPELTGRENIYLNGAILGMKRTEIERRFDEIVSFAEVEKFIDTPVKRFSSGMYLRLAFAVAAHLRSEVLLVDEVLAVGDAAFQKKCMGKMGEAAHEGRTVLFVSHNMAAVRSLCGRGLLLEDGRVACLGDIEEVLFRYSNLLAERQEGLAGLRSCFGPVRVNGRNPGAVESGQSFTTSCALQLPPGISGFRLFCMIQDVNGDPMVIAPASQRSLRIDDQSGRFDIQVSFPALWLRPGVYSVYFKLLCGSIGSGSARYLSDSMMLDITGSDDPEMLLGYLTPAARWEAVRPALVAAESQCF